MTKCSHSVYSKNGATQKPYDSSNPFEYKQEKIEQLEEILKTHVATKIYGFKDIQFHTEPFDGDITNIQQKHRIKKSKINVQGTVYNNLTNIIKRLNSRKINHIEKIEDTNNNEILCITYYTDPNFPYCVAIPGLTYKEIYDDDDDW